MSDGWNIALLGATGAVGEALLELLSERSAGATVRFNGKSLLANRTGTDSLPARQPLSPRPCGSFGLQSLSAIFLIALKVKRESQNQNRGFDLDVKSTFELPSEERRQGKRAGRPF
ncbi:aspartate-semialdehyde dehydrogenase [Yersinia mollaretii]|nr:aspartate-semialdehyde dehydrogenase [Yersinia mollaretii]